MKIELYYAPNTCALAPYVTLTEAGADFVVRPLNFRKRQNFTPVYLKINPKHKVPSLVVDGKILTENVGIHPFLSRINNPPKVCDGAADSVVKFATEGLFENFQIADDKLAGREYF